jgi:hypothetical protein
MRNRGFKTLATDEDGELRFTKNTMEDRPVERSYRRGGKVYQLELFIRVVVHYNSFFHLKSVA